MNNYDIVINQAHVMDPESGLDQLTNVGISQGKIAKISESPMEGEQIIDASGYVLCPGFIDLHCHPQDTQIFEVQALDGVTTTLELEVGTNNVSHFYSRWENQSPINFGASIGHIPVRMKVMNDPGVFLPSGDAGRKPATNSEIIEMQNLIRQGL